MPVYHIQPQDLLFFRDARPMEPQSPGGGHGARWPHPAVFFDAIHSALWRAFPDAASRELKGFSHHSFFFKKKNGERLPVSSQRTWFQSLRTAGPFPVRDGRWLFPCPADVQPNGGLVLPVTAYQGTSDLLGPPLYPLGSTSLSSKATVAPWWSKDAIEAYLAGCAQLGQRQAFEPHQLFAAEWTTGIGTDPLRDTQDGRRIYSAQYLRLRDDVRIGLWATLPERGPNGKDFDGLDAIFRQNAELPILLVGGQQRSCRVVRQDTADSAADLATLLPVSRPLPPDCTRLKWVLLSPAVFPAVPKQHHQGGWLPTWVHPQTGSVLLNEVRLDRTPDGGIHRKDRRSTKRPGFLTHCRLVAACIPKPVPITGWTEALHAPPRDALDDQQQPIADRRPRGPRETHLAVPAGAAYYFECPDHSTAQALWGLLSWHGEQTRKVDHIVHSRSSLLGEKGFGLGICAEWKPFPALKP